MPAIKFGDAWRVVTNKYYSDDIPVMALSFCYASILSSQLYPECISYSLSCVKCELFICSLVIVTYIKFIIELFIFVLSSLMSLNNVVHFATSDTNHEISK